jgi:glycerophosphoryl diester phosphodiesterase
MSAQRESTSRVIVAASVATAITAVALSAGAIRSSDAAATAAVSLHGRRPVTRSVTDDCLPGGTVLIAHRGTGVGTRVIDERRYTEDTIPAFHEAMSLGADGFETDYSPTADGHLVSNHDATLARTSTGTGPLHQRSWDYVRHQETTSGARIPSLEAVEEAMTSVGGLRQREIKRGSTFTGQMLREVVTAHEGQVPQRNVLVTSLDLSTLQRVHRITPFAATGLIAGRKNPQPPVGVLPRWLDTVLINLQALDPSYVDEVRAAGHSIAVRNVETASQLNLASELGVKRIITDRPEDLVKLRRCRLGSGGARAVRPSPAHDATVERDRGSLRPRLRTELRQDP